MAFKVIRQLERADCGPACIMMIARFYGFRISHDAVVGNIGLNKSGTSIYEMEKCLSHFGFSNSTLRIKLSDAYRMPLPTILFWNDSHFVILYKVDFKKRKFYIADPSEGKLKFDEKSFEKFWCNDSRQGIAILVEPTVHLNKNISDSKVQNKSRLFDYFSNQFLKYKKPISYILLLSLITMACDVVVPLIFRKTIDQGLIGKDIGLVWLLIISQVLIFLGNFVMSSFAQIIFSKVSVKMNLNMLNEYLEKLVTLPMSFFDRRVNSDLIQKVNDQSRIKDFILQLPQSYLFMILNFIIFSIMMLWFSGWIFMFFIFMSSLGLIWSLYFMKKRKTIDYSMFNLSADNRQLIYELINGMPDIKAGNAQNLKLKEWNDNQEDINKWTIKSTHLNIAMNGGSGIIARLKDIAISGICATLVIKGDMTLGTMMTISYITGGLSTPFNSLVGAFTSYQDAKISYLRLKEIIHSETPQGNVIPKFNDKISLHNVWFKYPGLSEKYVLTNLNIDIPKGSTIAIVGESGSGKSTLIKILLGFYEPTKGSLSVDGTEVADIDIDKWLFKCGVVIQDGYIFSGTIMHNISLNSQKVDVARVNKACEIANLGEFISSLPQGINTKIGNAGVSLSGGQKQRILIARAVYKDPEIIFLDEATSSLDAKNEDIIVNNLREVGAKKTVIIAAHRLSTISNADKIIFLKNGEIVEQGTPHQLLDLEGEYFNLVKRQLSS